MALNFCCARLKTKISSSAVSCEGHEVTNLLSSVPAIQFKGFMAEGFCKPPVSVRLNFICNIDINHIVLWVEVGCQKSNGVELHAAEGSDVSGDKTPNSVVYFRIGSCKLNNEYGVIFQKYNCWSTPEVPENFLKRFFNTSAATALENCHELEIKIFSTANSSVPSLKKVEVWGRPGRHCPEDLKHELYSRWYQPLGCPQSVPKNLDPLGDGRNSPIVPSDSSDVSELVPEEFLDPITLDIMAIPMTLPSGKAVDLSTLEKFECSEATWGRGPSDPFTGVPFSQSIFPIPDIALKSRIDQFLVENGHLAHLRGVGRTVGREKRGLNRLTVHSDYVKKRICEETSGGASSSGSRNNPSDGSSLRATIPPNISSLGDVIDDNCEEASKYSAGSETQRQCGLKRKRILNESSSSFPEQDVEGSHLTNHENDVEVSLNCALRSVLSGLPSFVNTNYNYRRGTNHEDDVEASLDCALQSVLSGLPSFVHTNKDSLRDTCKNTAKYECSYCLSKHCLFSLPCRHFSCRECLTKLSSENSGKMICKECHNHYNCREVLRFHY